MEFCNRWDRQILFGIAERRTKHRDRVMRFITYLGDCSKVWIIVAVAASYLRRYELTYAIISALLFAVLGNNLVIKSLFMRKRPCDLYQEMPLLIKRPIGSSFPSGHTATSFACATSIFMFHPIIGILSLILAAAIGVSRVYLFVHFPSDVIVGVISGIILGYAGTCVITHMTINYVRI